MSGGYYRCFPQSFPFIGCVRSIYLVPVRSQTCVDAPQITVLLSRRFPEKKRSASGCHLFTISRGPVYSQSQKFSPNRCVCCFPLFALASRPAEAVDLPCKAKQKQKKPPKNSRRSHCFGLAVMHLSAAVKCYNGNRWGGGSRRCCVQLVMASGSWGPR